MKKARASIIPTCPSCGKTCRTKGGLKYHTTRKHPEAICSSAWMFHAENPAQYCKLQTKRSPAPKPTHVPQVLVTCDTLTVQIIAILNRGLIITNTISSPEWPVWITVPERPNDTGEEKKKEKYGFAIA